MPKYFCEYCGVYLTHSSPGGRKQHARGKKHISNKIEYYSQFLFEFQRQAQQNGFAIPTFSSHPLASVMPFMNTINPGMPPAATDQPNPIRPMGAPPMNRSAMPNQIPGQDMANPMQAMMGRLGLPFNPSMGDSSKAFVD